MFYLNKTSTESMFSESQLYENMNRIVKLLDYKPIGKQTSMVTFGLSGTEDLPIGMYTAPRYSYVTTGGVSYSTNADITVSKSTSSLQSFDDAVYNQMLYQGLYAEYPQYQAVGNANEIMYIAPGDNVMMDHFNIDVYVYEASTGQWAQWARTTSLYLENGVSESYEVRLSESKVYELKFGNDINGKQLKSGDKVSVFYLQTDGSIGEIGQNVFLGESLKMMINYNLNQILDNINTRNNNNVTYTSVETAAKFKATNTNNSTYYQAEETVESIRKNAPGVFRSQYRVVVQDDYINFLKSNFANLIHDLVVVNNQQYMTDQMRYYYEDIGLKDPNNVSNLLYNQVNFADACNFNNIYITVVPKTITNAKNPTASITPAQKQLMISALNDVKTLTTEAIILDPVYIGVDLCITNDLANITTDVSDTRLVLIKDASSRRDDSSIILEVYNVFTNYFERDNIKLGQTLDVISLTSSLLSIAGIKTFYTQKGTQRYEGLSLAVWNPIYPSDATISTKNLPISYFKYLYLNDVEHFKNKILITQSATGFENIEH